MKIISIISFILLLLANIVYGDTNKPIKHEHQQPSTGINHVHNSSLDLESQRRLIKNTEELKKYGYFSKDKINVLWLNKGRKAKLLETLLFTDPDGNKWVASKGHIIDGASIPAPFQPLVGTPYGGKYVMASIIHDVACDEKKKPWQKVHQVFYQAMLASGVAPNKARLMYTAVYEGGPRWGKNAEKKLSDKDFRKMLMKKEYKELMADFKKHRILSGQLNTYKGTAIYNGFTDGKPVVGVVSIYNQAHANVEVGNGKPFLGIGYTYDSKRDNEFENTDEKRPHIQVQIEAGLGHGKPQAALGLSYRSANESNAPPITYGQQKESK